jgi:hypothetical protein
MEKVDRVGDHASAFVPQDEKSLVNRPIPRDENERQISEMQSEIGTLQVLLQTGGPDIDRSAMQARITTLKQLLAIKTSPAQFTDRAGKIG